jgi:putative colanic acid biosynthesis UDP-glucose lipid carrier transferase
MVQSGFVKQHHSFFTFLQQFLDICLVWGTFRLSALFFEINWSPEYESGAILATILYFILARHNSLYHSWRGQSISLELREVCKTWAMVLLAVLLIAYGLRTSDTFSRRVIASWIIVTPVLLLLLRIGARLFLRYARASGRNFRTVAIAGAGPLGVTLAKIIQNSPWMGIKIDGFYDDKLAAGSIPDAALNLPVFGDLEKLKFDARCNVYDEIYIALPMRAEKQMKKLVADLSDTSLQVHYVPDIFTFNLFNARIRDIGGLPTISVYDSPLDSIGRFIKRTEDLLIGTLIMFLIAVPMLLIALAIKLDSAGPVLFKQRRYGLSGEEIWVWKFRSMSVCEDGGEIRQATKGDARITRIGGFLRKTSLDELPQFLNVLQGTMSIVGPRPHAVAHNEQYRHSIEGYMLRHMVKPGITGWAQINGWRGETDTREKMEKRVECDLHYIRNWSIWLDLKIIVLTVFKGFINKNAY